MESDWEIEIAPDAPTIDAAWAGYIDLRTDLSRVREVSEAVRFPSLKQALVQLNSASSPVWTVKCDVWPVNEFDPDEMDADIESAISGVGCYIDLLSADLRTWSTLDAIIEWCRRLCFDLRTRPLRQCRLDAIVRSAFFSPDEAGLGVTVYVTACGHTHSAASAVLAQALIQLAKSVDALGVSGAETSKYNENIVGE